LCFYFLNQCVNHSALSFFSFLCDNLLLQTCAQSLCEITVFLCLNLIDPPSTCTPASRSSRKTLAAGPDCSWSWMRRTRRPASTSTLATTRSMCWQTRASSRPDCRPRLANVTGSVKLERLNKVYYQSECISYCRYYLIAEKCNMLEQFLEFSDFYYSSFKKAFLFLVWGLHYFFRRAILWFGYICL